MRVIKARFQSGVLTFSEMPSQNRRASPPADRKSQKCVAMRSESNLVQLERIRKFLAKRLLNTLRFNQWLL